MPKIPSLEEMLKAGVHFGHRTSRWHPKMAPYIFGVRGGVHVINVEETQKMLEKTLSYVEDVIARGGVVLFIGTKKQITGVVEKTAQACGMPYINNRWLGGTFTNFSEIQKLIKKYLELKEKREKGELKKYTKLEQLQFDRKIEELEEKIGGISTLKKLPEAIFVFDAHNEKTAMYEAGKQNVKVIAICDTNINPTEVDYVIPANDDSVRSLELIGSVVADSVNAGKKKQGMAAAPAKKNAKEDGDVAVTAKDRESVDALDDEVKEELAREKQESRKK